MSSQQAQSYIDSILRSRLGVVEPPPTSAPMPLFTRERNVICSLHPTLHMGQHPEFSHAHDMYELTYVYRGHFHQLIRGKKLVQAQGTLLMLNIGVKHCVWVEEEGDIVVNLLVQRDCMHRLFTETCPGNGVLSNFLTDRACSPYLLFSSSLGLSETMDDIIIESFAGRSLSDYVLQALVIKLLIVAAREYAPARGEPGRADKLSHIREYVEKNIATVRLSTMADHFGYSYRQMERIAREIYGMPFPDAVNIRRVRLVEERLRNGIALADALDAAGFPGASYYRKRLESLKQKYPEEWDR